MRFLILTLLAILLGTNQVSGFVLQMERFGQGRIVKLVWPLSQAQTGISFRVDAGSFPFTEGEVARVVRESFDVWQAVETASIRFTNQGNGTFRARASDGRNVILYDSDGSEMDIPDGSGVLAFTRVNWNAGGEITDADIVFNGTGSFNFTTSGTSARNTVDFQSVLTHEVGHFLGLNHATLEGSAAVRPTMYPFFFGGERTLEPDDAAGVSALYPIQRLTTGSISGRVTYPDGRGVFGASVVAYQGGSFVVSAISGSSGSPLGPGGNGGYEISGLPPGEYQVAIEPLTGSITSENLGGIFSQGLEVNFTREFYDNSELRSAAQLIAVGAGSGVGGIDFVLGSESAGFPVVRDLVLPVNTPDASGPYRVAARITDDVRVASASLDYRINGGAFRTVNLTRENGEVFAADLPGQLPGAFVEYRVAAVDDDGNEIQVPSQGLPLMRFEVLSLSGEPVLYVVMRESHVVSVIDTGPGREVARIPTGGFDPLSVVLTPDERYLFVANTGGEVSDDRVTVVETATHKVVATIQVGEAPLDMAVSPDGRWVYVTNSRGQSVSVLDAVELKEARRMNVFAAGDGPYGIAVSPDGETLYVTDIEASQVLVVESATGVITGRIGVVASPRSVVVSRDGTRLYACGFTGGIAVVDAVERRLIQTIETGTSSIFRLTLSPDGDHLYATDRTNSRLLEVDTRFNRVSSTWLTGGEETRDIAVSADGSVIYVANQNSDDLVFYDAESFHVVGRVDLPGGPRGIAVGSGSGSQVMVLEDLSRADFDGSLRVDLGDFVLFARAFGSGVGDSLFEARFDLNENERVDFGDFLIFANAFGRILVE